MATTNTKGPLQVFVQRSKNRKHALVHRQWADAIGAALLESHGCVPADKTGRGELIRFPYDRGWGIIRKYLRGGLVRHFVKDAYFLVNRPLRELRLHAHVFHAGLPVPEPLGVCWERRGLFVRGALATHEVKAVNLLGYLARDHGETGEMLRRCGALIRQMHDMGVFHADLQVRNILVGEDRLYLIDFDNAWLAGRLTPLQRARNLFRLRRSFEKNGLPLQFFQPICEGYGVEALPSWIKRIYRAKGKLPDRI